MPYVIRRDNPEGSKYKFSYYSPTGWHQLANRFDCTIRVPVFPSRKDTNKFLAEHGIDMDFLELNGWELVQVRNRKVEGLMAEAIKYNNKVRALAGTSAMMASLYRDLGFFRYAEDVESNRLAIRELLATQYAEIKFKLEMENLDAKSR